MLIRQLLSRKNNQFFALNILGWIGYYLSSYLGAIYWGDTVPNFYLVLIIGTSLGLALSFTMRPIFLLFWNYNVVLRIVIALFTAYVCSLIWVVPYNLAFWSLINTNHVPDTWTGYFWGVSKIFYIFVCWVCLYFGIKFYKGMQQAHQRALVMAALAHESQLEMLRYQLNPHFLFNTLNSISTLILDKQNYIANEMVTRLSNFLRHSLESNAQQKTMLSQELDALKLYLDIEKVRFQERLQLHFDIEPGCFNLLIPSLILQPISENAIKYAISQSTTGGSIIIKAYIKDENLYIQVIDDGPGINQTLRTHNSGTGVGLKNTRERLNEFYGNKHSFNMSNIEPHGLEVTIIIPKEVQSTSEQHQNHYHR